MGCEGCEWHESGAVFSDGSQFDQVRFFRRGAVGETHVGQECRAKSQSVQRPKAFVMVLNMRGESSRIRITMMFRTRVDPRSGVLHILHKLSTSPEQECPQIDRRTHKRLSLVWGTDIRDPVLCLTRRTHLVVTSQAQRSERRIT